MQLSVGKVGGLVRLLRNLLSRVLVSVLLVGGSMVRLGS